MSYTGPANISLESRQVGAPEQHRFEPVSLEALQEVQLSPHEVPSLGTTRAIAEVAIVPYLGEGQDNGQGSGQGTESGNGSSGEGGTKDNSNNGDIRRKNSGGLTVLHDTPLTYTIEAKDGGKGGSDNGKADSSDASRRSKDSDLPGRVGGSNMEDRKNGSDPNKK